MVNMEEEEEIVVRIRINEHFWRSWIKSPAVQRGEPVQDFAANLLRIGARILDEKEDILEQSLEEAERKYLDSDFRVLRGGAILFKRNRELHMELVKGNIHIHITYYGIFADRDPEHTIVGMLWGPEDLDKQKIENEDEKKIILEALQIAQTTFSKDLKDYARFNIYNKETGRLL